MLRNLDNVSGKFLMYPRFIQTFLDKQLDGLPTYKEKYDVSFHTKKVFANIKIFGKGFSSKETPLFPTMVGPNQVQMGEDIAADEAVHKEGVTVLCLFRFRRWHVLLRFLSLVSLQTLLQMRLFIRGGDSLVRATSIASSLEAEKDSGDTSAHTREVGEEEVVEVVTTAKMLIDTVVDVAQVTTAIADILVSAAEIIFTTALTITAESTKINVEAKVDVAYQLAERLQAEEQEQLMDAENAKLFMELLEKMRKTELVEESFKKDEAETAQESSSKRAEDELDQERSKKQKVEDNKESEELKKCLEIIPDDRDDVTIDATPLSVKTLIGDYKIYKEWKKNYF
nr:hypothetical protein [Tanacetum cinerariifolium]